jgi:S1-C subfamily serine protease
MGVVTNVDTTGVVVVDIDPAGAAAAAGVAIGDRLVAVGEVAVQDPGFGEVFRAVYASRPAGSRFDIVVERAGQRLSLSAALEFAETTLSRIVADERATPKATRIRDGILTGAVQAP